MDIISHNYDSVMAYAMIDIEAALAKAVRHLGYECLSLEQRKAIMQFLADQDAFKHIHFDGLASLSLLLSPCQ